MTIPKYLILLLTVSFSSCSNDPTDITEANTYYSDKQVDTLRQIAKQKNVDPELLIFWTHFKEIVSKKNYKEFKNISLNNLKTCDITVTTKKFLNKCFLEVFDTTLLKKFAGNSPTDYLIDDTKRKDFPQSVLRQINLNDSIIVLRRFQIEKGLTSDGPWIMAFDFVKTKKGYKFYGCDSYGGPICCR